MQSILRKLFDYTFTRVYFCSIVSIERVDSKKSLRTGLGGDNMGKFLNAITKRNSFTFITKNKYFVDKTALIQQMNELIDTSDRFVCITRPRRFGKSINALMLATYYANSTNAKGIFDGLNISKYDTYLEHLNKHNVIYISFNAGNDLFETYSDYKRFFRDGLIEDLQEICPDIRTDLPISEIFKQVMNKTDKSFIFILDEWDYIFNNNKYSQDDRKNFLEFLTDLLKDKPYVELAYMTGVLPIAKYSSGSTINMFREKTFLNDTVYEKYFGFTQEEVEILCKKQDAVSMEELEGWYNGYYMHNGGKLYNPNSVVEALNTGVCQNYWASLGPMNEISALIQETDTTLNKYILSMVAGNTVNIKLRGYTPENNKLDTPNKVLSLMAICGFLSYYNESIRIPNKEVLEKFEALLEEKALGSLRKVLEQSEDLLNATLAKDEDMVAKMVEKAHDANTTYFKYSDENSMACVIMLAYYFAKRKYDIKREDVTGKGRADFAFYPHDKNDTAFVIELKSKGTVDEAIEQIKSRDYGVAFESCTGEKLAIGIAYDKNSKDKKHKVKIVEL